MDIVIVIALIVIAASGFYNSAKMRNDMWSEDEDN